MIKKMIAVGATLLLLLLPCVTTGQAAETDGIEMATETAYFHFAHNNPDMTFFYREEANDTLNHFKVSFNRLVENAGSRPVGSGILVLSTLEWSHTNVTEDENGTKSFEFYVNDGGIEMHIGIYVFSQNMTVMNGNESVEVSGYDLKFDLSLSGWTFGSPDNNLTLEISFIANKCRNHAQQGETTQLEGENNQTAYMKQTQTAVVDGENVQYATNRTFESNRIDMGITFPAFDDTLYYDPLVGVASTDEPEVDDDDDDSTEDERDAFIPASIYAALIAPLIAAACGKRKKE